MKYFNLRATLFGVLSLFVAVSAMGQGEQIPEDDLNKRAQTGMKFLQTSVDARAAGMGSAVTAMEGYSASAVFYNPAGIARLTNNVNVALGQTQLFADINYSYASAMFAPSGGQFGVFGAFLMAVDYGDFLGTVRADNESGFLDTGTYSPTALSAGISYAKLLSDRFAVGANIKYVLQDLTSTTISAEESRGSEESVIAVDFGVLYNTGFRSLTFAMSARNFSQEVTYEEEAFELPLTFTIGVSMDMLDLTNYNTDMHSFVLSVDAERPRDFYEHVNIGGEYSLNRMFFLRAGYAFPTDEEGINLGLGLNFGLGESAAVSANYSFTDFGILGEVHRIGAAFSF